MDNDLIPSSISELFDNMAEAFLLQLGNLVELIVTPGWRQYQIAIILGLVALSFLLTLLTKSRWEAGARARSGWPKWRLRVLVQLMQRMTWSTSSCWPGAFIW